MANQRASNRSPEVLALRSVQVAGEVLRDIPVDDLAVGTEARKRFLAMSLETVLEEDRVLLVELAAR